MATTTVNGIDVSKWQGSNIDWAKVAASGIKFAILRAGYGSSASQKDSTFERNYAGAKAAGLLVGAYWYSYATSVAGAKNEAAACLSCIKGKSFDLPIYFDQEYEPGILALSNVSRTSICKAFCEAIKAAGYTPGIYASTDFINNKLSYTELADYSIWAAQYSSKCTCKAAYDMWQYSSSGKVSGISGNCDLNRLTGAKAEGWFTGAAAVSSAATSTAKDYIKLHQAYVNSVTDTGIAVDGIFGPKTLTASIMALQTAINSLYDGNLKVDGIFGPLTKASCGLTRRGDGGILVHLLQGMLYCRGYDPKGLDYSFGACTEAAVRAFQTDAGIAVDGVVGPVTWETVMTK